MTTGLGIFRVLVVATAPSEDEIEESGHGLFPRGGRDDFGTIILLGFTEMCGEIGMAA